MIAQVSLDGRLFEIELTREEDLWIGRVGNVEYRLRATRRGDAFIIDDGGEHIVRARENPLRVLSFQLAEGGAGAGGGAQVRPPMNGKIVRLAVQEGQVVAAGDVLFVLEAMKMQNEVKAPRGGTVTDLNAAAGDVVVPTQVLFRIG